MTRRRMRISWMISACSFSRPMKVVNEAGRLFGMRGLSVASASGQIPQPSLPGKFQQTRSPFSLPLDMQGGEEQSRERCYIGHALILFDTADLRIAVSNLNGEFALGEFFAPAQIFEQVTKGGKLFW